MKTYSSGEAARHLGVSLRTVQYYDRQQIVSPSFKSEKDRRIYTEEDLKKLELAILYRELGFALKDIRNIMYSESPDTLLSEMLSSYHHHLSEDIRHKQEQLDKIELMQKKLKKEGSLAISNHQQLVMLLETKRADHRTMRLLAGYLGFLFLSFPICLSFHLPELALFLAAAGLLLLVFYHASRYRYLCPHCQRLFELPWYRDLFSLHDPKKGKYTRCPHCHQRGWMEEFGKVKLYKDSLAHLNKEDQPG